MSCSRFLLVNKQFVLYALINFIGGLYCFDIYAKEPMTDYQLATFAGGCFWCMQPEFDQEEGVTKTVVGFAGGKEVNPTYEQVSSNETHHVESIQITYDPTKTDYHKLLTVFWKNIDPTNDKGQFCDKGDQYRSVIFFHDEEQKKQAQASKETLLKKHKISKIYTDIRPFTTFYPAEDYHQKYYKKNPVRYKFYRFSCGRDQKLKEIWGQEN